MPFLRTRGELNTVLHVEKESRHCGRPRARWGSIGRHIRLQSIDDFAAWITPQVCLMRELLDWDPAFRRFAESSQGSYVVKGSQACTSWRNSWTGEVCKRGGKKYTRNSQGEELGLISHADHCQREGVINDPNTLYVRGGSGSRATLHVPG